jgi:hypothetical protein
MRLFKSACLNYKPSQVRFQDSNWQRENLINMQRQLSDALTATIVYNRSITADVQPM